MALIGDIRKRGGLIAIVIGGALAAFILGDLISPGGGSSQVFDIGEIAGESIPARKFEAEVQEKIDNFKEQSQQTSLDQATIDMIREQAWSQKLNEVILGAEYSSLGLAVHPKEIFELVTGPKPHQSVLQAFSNPNTGAFNPQDVIGFLKGMDNDATGARRAQWLPFETAIIIDRKAEKYFNLIKKGLYATEKEAMLNYQFVNGSAKFKYVLVRYNDIPDSAVTVSDTELKSYYNEHRKEHEQDASRGIKYVVFDVFPSPDDSLVILDWMNGVKEDLTTAAGIEEISSLVNRTADTRYVDKYYKAGDLSPRIDSIMFAADSARVEGPYIENGAQTIVRWIDTDDRPDSVKFSHILIPPSPNGDSAYVKTADSIMIEIEKGADFALLATTLSADANTAPLGGDMGWFVEGDMFKPLNDTCFTSEVGDLKMVLTPSGAHVINITDKTELIKKVKVAIVDRRIEPSSETFAKIYAHVNKFAGSNRSEEDFEASAREEELVIREAGALSTTDKLIIGLESPRAIIRWAYKVEQGTVSGPFELGNKYVVAVLTSVKEEGYATLDDIRTEMEVGALNKKKGEYILTKLEENDDQNIDDLAANLSSNNDEFNLTVQYVQQLSFADFNITGVGSEPKLIGNVYASKINELSGPVEGNAGVFLFMLEEMKAAPDNEEYSANKTRLNSDLANRVDFEVFNALKKSSEIVDNRHLFY